MSSTNATTAIIMNSFLLNHRQALLKATLESKRALRRIHLVFLVVLESICTRAKGSISFICQHRCSSVIINESVSLCWASFSFVVIHIGVKSKFIQMIGSGCNLILLCHSVNISRQRSRLLLALCSSLCPSNSATCYIAANGSS